MSTEHISPLTYLALVLSAISLFILSYLWYKFWELRNHFLISARFPKVTLFISITVYISGVCGVFTVYYLDVNCLTKQTAYMQIFYQIIVSIAMTLAWSFCGAIVFRALLIYDVWKTTTYTLDNKSTIILGPDPSDNTSDKDKATKKCKCCGSNIVLFDSMNVISIGIIFVILAIMMAVSGPFLIRRYVVARITFMIPWLLVIIIGIVILWKARKIKESVLCIRETYFVVIIILLQIIIGRFESFLDQHMLLLCGTFLALFAAFLIIVLSLWMVYKHEGTLKRTDMEINKFDTKVIKYHSKLQLNIATTSTSIPIPTDQAKEPVFIPLHQYLAQGDENYNEFADFLSSCFALENLLFFARVIVFRNVLLRIVREKGKQRPNDVTIFTETDTIETDQNKQIQQETEKRGEELEDKWCPMKMKQVFSVRFDYVDGLYDSCSPKGDVSIDQIGRNIYEQFISSDGINEVNISWEHRDALTEFFEREDGKDIEEYLEIFNGTIQEIYGVLQSVYKFQFQSNSRLSTL